MKVVKSGVDLRVLLRSFRKSAFRLEGRQQYLIPKEAELFEAWRRTEEVPDFTPDNDPWCKLVADHVRDGKRIQRVHLVQEPLSDYLRFEFACQEHHLKVGEDIRVVVVQEPVTLLDLDRLNDVQDFWLLDDRTVIRLDYDLEGRFTGAYEDDDLERYLSVRDECMRRSRPLKGYLYSR